MVFTHILDKYITYIHLLTKNYIYPLKPHTVDNLTLGIMWSIIVFLVLFVIYNLFPKYQVNSELRNRKLTSRYRERAMQSDRLSPDDYPLSNTN